MTYAQQAWAEERAAWRTVIQLNLLRNVNTILDVLTQEMSAAVVDDSSDEDLLAGPSSSKAPPQAPLRFSEKHRLLRLRLLPLRSVQEDLQARLGASDWPTPKTGSDDSNSRHRPQDFFVWSNASWKSALRPGRHSVDAAARAEKGLAKRKESHEKETTGVLASCADDIKALWRDETVQEMLRRRRVRLDLMPGLCVSLSSARRPLYPATPRTSTWLTRVCAHEQLLAGRRR